MKLKIGDYCTYVEFVFSSASLVIALKRLNKLGVPVIWEKGYPATALRRSLFRYSSAANKERKRVPRHW